MKHLKAFLIKFIATFAVLYLILGFGYGMTFREVFMLSAVLGVLAYLIGDLFILPRTNNTVGTIADFLLAWAVIYYFVVRMAPTDNEFTASLIATAGVVIFEIYFHRYVHNHVLPNEVERTGNREHLRYQVETAEELDAQEVRNKWENKD